MATDYGYRKVRRSAYAHSTGQLTDIYLGECATHGHPVRYEGTDVRPAGQIGVYLAPCPKGPGHLVQVKRLVAVTTTVTCDGSCMSARRADCACGCGGINHGKSWGVTATSEQFESALASYQAEQAKLAEKREKAAGARERKARQGYEAWAAEHAELLAALEAHKPDELGYPQPGSNSFLCDMARQALVHRRELSGGQLAAAERVVAEVAARAARKAAMDAEIEARKATAKPVPQGKATVTGEIVKIKAGEGYMPDTVRLQAIVAAEDGYAVMITLPAAIERWATDNRREQLWEDYETDRYSRSSRGTDYEGAGRRWTKALKGTKITFTAQLERSRKDETFGFGKRPTGVTFEPAACEGCGCPG